MEVEQCINYLTEGNGVTVKEATSETSGCLARHLLNNNDRQLWLSDANLPQEIVFNISNMKTRTDKISWFGWKCWHSYTSNPKLVELHVSTNGFSYAKWGSGQAPLKSDIQMFQIDPLPGRYKFLKLVIKESQGANKVYMNQVYLLEDFPISPEQVPPQQPVKHSYDLPKSTPPKQHSRATSFDMLKEKLNDMSTTVNLMQVESAAYVPPITSVPPLSYSYAPLQQSPAPFQQSLAPMQHAFGLTPVKFTDTPASSERYGDLHKTINKLSGTVNDMKHAIRHLSDKIDDTSQHNNSSQDMKEALSEFKHNVIRDISEHNTPAANRSPRSRRSPRAHQEPAAYEQPQGDDWERNMNEWQERVLQPRLNELSESLEHKFRARSASQSHSSTHTPVLIPKSPRRDRTGVTDIMSVLNSKLREKSQKLAMLEQEHRLRKVSPVKPYDF